MPKITGTGLSNARRATPCAAAGGDVLVMIGRPAHHGAQADHRVVPAAVDEPARDLRHLEGAGRVRHGDVLLADPVALEPVESALAAGGP
jgi:hypothetical protein